MMANLEALQLETIAHCIYQYCKIIGINEDRKNEKMMTKLRERSLELLNSYRSQDLHIGPSEILFLSMSYAKLSEFEDIDGLQLVLEDLNTEVATIYRE